jgi:nitrogenase molybdenum-cofactor synthesis protein NifE
LSNPIWEQVRRPAPWAEISWEDRADAENAADEAALAADPVLAEQTRRAETVCHCKQISTGTIEDAVRDHDLTVIAQVTQLTQAGGGCGGCKDKIASILSRVAASAAPPAQVA